MTDFGFSDEATVFVSVCTSALTGRASGVGVDVVHRSSCAVWEPGPTQRGQPAVAVLRFADRNAPSHLIGLVAVIVAIAGAVAAALWARSTRPEIAGPDLSVAAVAAVISLVLAFVAWVQGISAGDSWSETGQDFDEQLRNGYRTVSFVALVGGVLCPAIVLVAGAVRRCRAKRP